MPNRRSGWGGLSPEQPCSWQPDAHPPAARSDRVPCAPMADGEACAAFAEVHAQAGDERHAAVKAQSHGRSLSSVGRSVLRAESSLRSSRTRPNRSRMMHIRRPRSPAASGYNGPNRFDQSKWPCTLQEAISRAQNARSAKGENEPRAAVLKGVAYQHRRNRKDTEKG